MEEQIIPTIGSFWDEFGFGRLYDTRWADIIRSSNVLAPLPTREELLINGAA
jgi:hypothetical protein